MRYCLSVAMSIAASWLFAMPSVEEIDVATKSIKPIIAKFNGLSAGEQASAALSAGKNAATEAERYLLIRGAFFKYVKLEDADKAIDALQEIPKHVNLELPHILDVIDMGVKKATSACAAELKRFRRDLIELELKKLEPQYHERKDWYKAQLKYNGLRDGYFMRYGDGSLGGFSYMVVLGDEDGGDQHEIKLENGRYLTYPPSMPKGFAEDLISARIIIYRYEHPDEPFKHEDIKESRDFQKRLKQVSADREKRLKASGRRSRGGTYGTDETRRIKSPSKSDLKRFK